MVSIFTTAITELLLNHIKPDYSFAFRIFASTDNDPDVMRMVTQAIKNWNYNRWEINQSRYFRATAELIKHQQPEELVISLDEEIDESIDESLVHFLYSAANSDYNGKLNIVLRSPNSCVNCINEKQY